MVGLSLPCDNESISHHSKIDYSITMINIFKIITNFDNLSLVLSSSKILNKAIFHLTLHNQKNC